MQVQHITDAATAANATTMGAGEASRLYRTALKNSFKVVENLKPPDRSYLQRVCSFPLVFTNERTITHDHALLAAMRQLARDAYEASFHVSRSSERVLVVGATMREIRMYNSNPHIHYWVAGCENKDVIRTVRPAFEAISRELRRRIGKADPRVCNIEELPRKLRNPVLRFRSIQETLRQLNDFHGLPDCIHTEPETADTLVFEDTIYNYDADALTKLFVKTGARCGFGYALLPMELLFPEMPETRMYRVKRVGDRTMLTFKGGYSNGYVHKTDAWSTLLRHTVIKGNGVSLMVELTARVGPMVVFQLARCTVSESVPRTIELPEEERFVQFLDIRGSVNMRNGKALKNLKYIPIREKEYFTVFNYLLALDPKSRSITNAMSFIRRRAGGVSLVTKELVAPWDLPARHEYDLALSVHIHVNVFQEKQTLILENLSPTSVYERVIRSLRAIALPITLIRDWIFVENLTDRLLLFPDNHVTQVDNVEVARFRAANLFRPHEKFDPGQGNVYCDYPDEIDVPNCPVCQIFHGKLGRQRLICEHKQSSVVEIGLTDAQVQELRTRLIDTDGDPAGLAAVKKKASEKMPKAGFTRKVKVNYIRGGPGTGKSYAVRAIADESDLVVAPFTKLKPDYENLENQTGDKYDLTFKTPHRAMEMTGHSRIFCDEFTSFPYEMLACILEVNGAEELFLVGDESQCKTREPEEGMYIGRHMDLSAISRHELVYNFRNPPEIVAWLNKSYGYRMIPVKKTRGIAKFCTPDELPECTAIRMAFSKNTAKSMCEDEKLTVRSYQGSTSNVSVLFVNANDGILSQQSELVIVAMSRHREAIYIVGDDSEAARAFEANLGFTPEFYEHLSEFVNIELPTETCVILADEEAEKAIKVHPVYDAHRLAAEDLPSFATDPVASAANDISSQVAGDTFANGTVDIDALTTPYNQRGHPKPCVQEYFAFGPGLGNTYSKAPGQELAVAAHRYLSPRAKSPAIGYQKLAKVLVDMWMHEHTEDGPTMIEEEISAESRRFLAHCKERHYNAKFTTFDNPDSIDVRFHLKSIFKPKVTGDPDPWKVGQGISAWSSDLQAMFGFATRLMSSASRRREKSHILSDHGMSEVEFSKRCFNAINALPNVAKTGITDVTEFDSKQNAFTQMIERYYWEAHGVSEYFLDCYFRFRKDYPIIGSCFRGKVGANKASGEPLTLYGNGIVSKILANAVLRGNGPCVFVYKGDDGCKRQCDLTIDVDMAAQILKFVDLRLKIEIGGVPEFCGLVATPAGVFPNLQRKLVKIYGHRYRDYDHFCEYQKSLRDFENMVNSIGADQCIAGNAWAFDKSFEDMTACFESICSFGHIDEVQWHDAVDCRETRTVVPVQDGNGNLTYTE